jgi:thiamine kinase-like enzyme
VVKTATAYEYTTGDSHSIVSSLCVERPKAKDIYKEMFPVYGGMCLPRKAVHKYVEKLSQGRSKSQMMPDQVRKWLRQQSKDFYPAGFDALVKAMKQVYR